MPRSSTFHRGSVGILLWMIFFIMASTVRAQPSPTPVTGHPRLFLRGEDLPRLRSWAVDTNPIYRDGLAALADRAKTDMDEGHVPKEDSGNNQYETYPVEEYAELFGFMSLVSPDSAARDDYARRARQLLMYVLNEAAKGPAEGKPFRDPQFAAYNSNRSRWWGEGFALTVDWIYPSLSAADKATIRQVFLRWSDEIVNTGYHHPEPVGLVNDPRLVSNPLIYRWAANNYFTAHMRNLGLMSMALDPADDPEGRLGGYLKIATGAHLYMVDYLLRHDSAGGLLPEGFEYSPLTAAYIAQFLLALHTAGRDDPAIWGPQVVLADNPFWKDLIPAYLHSLSPVPIVIPEADWMGPVYQPAWFGDGESYYSPDFMPVFGPLALNDRLTSETTRPSFIRWIETNMAPGGSDLLTYRVGQTDTFLPSLLYFMVFDPDAAPPVDPRPSQPLEFYAPGLGRILARTGWDAESRWFTYKLGWAGVDHQLADGNQIEFYRKGEWLTKERSGYGLDNGASIDHNTLSLQNDPPDHNDPDDYRFLLAQLGSQWYVNPAGDGRITARSSGPGYLAVTGDATDLYNSTDELSTDILHASRSVVWLSPDYIVVYDRAASKTANRFKLFTLNGVNAPAVSGNRSTFTTPKGQKLFVTTLLPADAAIKSEEAKPLGGDAAVYEPMKFRLRVEAPGGPASARFLHVLQGADAATPADPAALLQSSNGTPFAGAWVNGTAVLFPVDLDAPFTGLTYTAPAATTAHRITGLKPNGGYDVTMETVGDGVKVTVNPNGTAYTADSGGVIRIGEAAPPARLPGDINGDGKIRIDDAVRALQAAIGLTTLPPDQAAAADFNGDGKINVSDVTSILRKAVGL